MEGITAARRAAQSPAAAGTASAGRAVPGLSRSGALLPQQLPSAAPNLMQIVLVHLDAVAATIILSREDESSAAGCGRAIAASICTPSRVLPLFAALVETLDLAAQVDAGVTAAAPAHCFPAYALRLAALLGLRGARHLRQCLRGIIINHPFLHPALNPHQRFWCAGSVAASDFHWRQVAEFYSFLQSKPPSQPAACTLPAPAMAALKRLVAARLRWWVVCSAVHA